MRCWLLASSLGFVFQNLPERILPGGEFESMLNTDIKDVYLEVLKICLSN